MNNYGSNVRPATLSEVAVSSLLDFGNELINTRFTWQHAARANVYSSYGLQAHLPHSSGGTPE